MRLQLSGKLKPYDYLWQLPNATLQIAEQSMTDNGVPVYVIANLGTPHDIINNAICIDQRCKSECFDEAEND